ncbi:MAG: phosphatase PAP2 family protein [Bacteroidota bacterium]|nr:phosphatase PAP2 family protein [Bacteroidota bacterium]
MLPYIAFIAVLLAMIITYDKAILHISLNKFHTGVSDVFFKYFTYAGNGVMIAFAVVILLFINYRFAVGLTIAGISTGVVIQFLKRMVFVDYHRPKYFFENIYQSYDLYIVSGTQPALHHSFPSGHSAAAFTLYFFLALLVKNKLLIAVFFAFAALAAYSRVYLSFHFTQDILAGSVIDVLIAYGAYLLINKLKHAAFNDSLLKLITKNS